MPQAQFGKKNFKKAVKEINTDLDLVTTLLERLLENNLTATERNRIVAQLTLANSRIGKYVTQIEKMGQNLSEDTAEEKALTEK